MLASGGYGHGSSGGGNRESVGVKGTPENRPCLPPIRNSVRVTSLLK